MKHIDKDLIVRFKQINQDLRAGRFEHAVQAYELLGIQHPQISEIIKFNLSYARAKITGKDEKKKLANDTNAAAANATPSAVSTPAIYKRKPFPKQTEKLKSSLSIAVVLHIYHADVVDECLDKIGIIPYDFKLIVTTPLTADHEAIIKVKNRFPEAEVICFENAGRDIGPFIKSWDLIRNYDICCKLHTKKGVSDYIEAWKHLCFEGILQSPAQISGIVKEFEADKKLSLAGPELLYGSLAALVGNNKSKLIQLTEQYKLSPALNDHDGFFMGTMFWFRTKSFSFISKFKSLKFGAEAGQKDGMSEHAIERMLGSYFIKDGKILLTRLNDKYEFSAKKVNSDYKSKVNSFHKHFDDVHESYSQLKNIVGHIHTGAETDRSVSGWIALKGSNPPRNAVIRIDDEHEIEIFCDRHRTDLERNGINQGRHAFNSTIPFKYMDGHSHTFALVDSLSGKTVSTISKIKQRSSDIDVVRSYAEWDWDNEKKFLAHLEKYQPSVPSDAFASIIMPTYNRAGTISTSINSVLMQSFSNFELIVVDDGSTDITTDIIKKCYRDSRIKYIKIKNQGVSHARNIGLEHASGKFVFFLDSDNSWRQNYLEIMIRYMSLYRLNSTYCGLRAFSEDNKTTHYKGCNFSWLDCVQSNYIDLNAFGFNRHSFSEMPKFNTELRRLVDWDYILRIAQYNSISYAPFLGVDYYDGSKDRITNTVYRNSEELKSIISMIQGQFSSFKRFINEIDYTYDRLKKFKHEPTTKSAPTVTTMITSYNHEKHIGQAISSVINQHGNFKHRIIISDDGSTDSTREIIKAYAAKYPNLITDLSSEVNAGVSKNMRRCIEATTTKYLAICEGDDFWTDPRKLFKQISFLETRKELSMVFSQILIKNETKDMFELLPRQQNLSSDCLTGWDFINEPTMNLIGNFSCCLFRSSVLKAMPDIMFDTRLNEIAVAFHVEKFGEIGFIKKPMSVYRQHSNGLWTGSQKRSQLLSGLAARKMALAVANPEYSAPIQEIIESKYTKELAKLERDDLPANTSSVA